MDAKAWWKRMASAALLVAVAAAGSACSKFGRLTGADAVSRVTVGSGGGAAHTRTAQTGGVMVWAEAEDGTQAAFYLASETATQTLTLAFGSWTFYATGWDGGSIFQGNARCGSTSVNVQGSTTDVTIAINEAGCAAASFFGTSAVRPLSLVTCNVVAASLTGDSNCDGFPLGDLHSFQVQANTYNPTVNGDADLLEPATSACVSRSTPSTLATALSVPEGAGSGSPIDITIVGYPGTACTGTPVYFDFNDGLAAAGAYSVFRNNGTSSGLNRNVVFLEDGPEGAPSVSTVTAAKNPLRGGFALTVNGSFDLLATVKVGGVNCPVTTRGTSSLQCTAPAAYNTLAVAVTVTDHDGQQATQNGAFSYADDGFGNFVDADTVGDNVTVSAGIIDTSDATNSAMTAIFGGRALQSFRNVAAMSGNTLTLATAFASADFAANDDVLWHVSAASSATACVSSGSLPVGTFGFARVVSANPSGDTVTLDQSPFANPSATAIAATNRNAGNTFCVVQLVRVPNFYNLTIDTTGGAVGITPPKFSLANGYGGILALKVANALTFAGANAATLDATGTGFAGGLAAGVQGDGALGIGAMSTSGNGGSGGGGNATSGGGGGGGVSGNGQGAYNAVGGAAGSALDPYGFQAGFGGAGGDGNSASSGGGSGGGIVLLYAVQIVNPPALTLYSNGTDGGSDGVTGGGAASGGTIYAQVASGSGGFSAVAKGGNGGAGSGNGTGGGGGGGFTSFTYCNGIQPTFTPTVTAGTGYTGAAGGAGSSSPHPLSSATYFCP